VQPVSAPRRAAAVLAHLERRGGCIPARHIAGHARARRVRPQAPRHRRPLSPALCGLVAPRPRAQRPQPRSDPGWQRIAAVHAHVQRCLPQQAPLQVPNAPHVRQPCGTVTAWPRPAAGAAHLRSCTSLRSLLLRLRTQAVERAGLLQRPTCTRGAPVPLCSKGSQHARRTSAPGPIASAGAADAGSGSCACADAHSAPASRARHACRACARTPRTAAGTSARGPRRTAGAGAAAPARGCAAGASSAGSARRASAPQPPRSSRCSASAPRRTSCRQGRVALL